MKCITIIINAFPFLMELICLLAAGNDYSSRSGIIIIQPGSTTNCTFIPITNDGDVEQTESFTISFSMFGGLPPDTPTPPSTVAVVTIIDDGELMMEVNMKKLKVLILIV